MWLLENDIGYAAYVIAGHESQGRTMRQDSLMDNKVCTLSHTLPDQNYENCLSLAGWHDYMCGKIVYVPLYLCMFDSDLSWEENRIEQNTRFIQNRISFAVQCDKWD